MNDNDDWGGFSWGGFDGLLAGGLFGRRVPLSAAGRMLQRIERADADAEVCPTSDELLCALKRADIKGKRA